jgi:hypothetical protein
MAIPSTPSGLAIARRFSLDYRTLFREGITATCSTSTNTPTGYQLRWLIQAGVYSPEIEAVNIAAPEWILSDVSGTLYDVQVRAYNASGYSAWSATGTNFLARVSATGVVLIPAVTGVAVTRTSATVTYNYSPGTTDYASRIALLLEWGHGSSYQSRVCPLPLHTRGSGLTTVLSGLPASTDMTVTAMAYDGYSFWSKSTTVTAFTSGAETGSSISIISPASGGTFPGFQGVTYSPLFTITCTSAIASKTITGLPTGMTSNIVGSTVTITGTPTTVGDYTVSVSITGTNTGVTTATYTVSIGTPAIVLVSEALTGAVGVAYAHNLHYTIRGPVGAVSTWTLTNAPSWLAVDAAGALSSATPLLGFYSFGVTASDGTTTATQQYTLEIKAIAITSASTLNAYSGATISFQLNANLTADVSWYAVGLPSWLTLNDHILEGIAPDAVETDSVAITVVSGGLVAQQTLTVNVISGLDGPIEITAWINDPVRYLYDILPTGTPNSYTISGGPPGVTFVASTYTADGALLGGAPTAEGLFEATLTVVVTDGPIVTAYRKSVNFYVSGKLFLEWIHRDPLKYDLQVTTRDQTVRSYHFASEAEGLWLKRGDHSKLYVIFRNGPTSAEVYGRTFADPTAFTLLSFSLRPSNNYDAEPFIQISAVPTLLTIGTHVVCVLEFDVTSDSIEAQFEAINSSAGDDSNEAALVCDAEITWKDAAGKSTSSRTFSATIAQDVDR